MGIVKFLVGYVPCALFAYIMYHAPVEEIVGSKESIVGVCFALIIGLLVWGFFAAVVYHARR